MRKLLFFAILLLSFEVGYAQRAAYKQKPISYLILPLNPLPKDILTYSAEIKGTTSLKMDEKIQTKYRDIEITTDSLIKFLTFHQLKKVGFNENPDLMVEVDLGTGFAHEKEVLHHDEVKNPDKSVTHNYYYTFAYSQPFAYTIKKKDGSVLSTGKYGGTDMEFVNKEAIFNTEDAAKKDWAYNYQKIFNGIELLKTMEFLTKLYSEVIVDKYSIKLVSKENIAVGKAEGNEKKYDFTDLNGAYDIMLAGIEKYSEQFSNADQAKLNISMLKDTGGFTTELSKAIPIYEKALTESNPSDKNARINDKITGMIHYNLSLIYYITDDFEMAEKHIGMASEYEKGDDNKRRKDMIADKKARYQANGLLK